MVTVIVNHEVKDYAPWRKVFDADSENRSKVGFKVTGVYRSIEKPNLITIIGEVPSVEKIKQFVNSPELKMAMEKGGVLGMPEVKMLNTA